MNSLEDEQQNGGSGYGCLLTNGLYWFSYSVSWPITAHQIISGLLYRTVMGLTLSFLIALLKDFFGCEDPIQGCRKSSVNSHLYDNLNNFLTRQANIESAVDMDLQLWRCRTQGCKRRDSSDLVYYRHLIRT